MNKNTPSKAVIKSEIGYMPPDDKAVEEFIADQDENTKLIFMDAYRSLKLVNHNNVHNLPMLKAYAMSWSAYFKINERLTKAEDYITEYYKDGVKSGETVSAKANSAHKMYTAALTMSKQLGLDPKSRMQLIPGPQPEKPTAKEATAKMKAKFLAKD